MIRRFVIGILVLASIQFATLQITSAHAIPDRTRPPMDQAVPVMPSTIDVWFSEEVNPEGTELQVLRLDGTRVDLENTSLDLDDPNRSHVTVGVHPGLDSGVYLVQWTSVSAIDGDTVNGSYQFTVDPAASPQPLPQIEAQQAPAQILEVDTTGDDDTDSGRDFSITTIGIVGALVLAGLLIVWFFRRPAHGRRWKDDVVDRL